MDNFNNIKPKNISDNSGASEIVMGPKINPQKSYNNSPAKYNSQAAAIKLEELTVKNKMIVFDSSALLTSSFTAFLNKNFSLLLSTKNCLFIPSFELESCPDSAKPTFMKLIDNGIFNLLKYNGVSSYMELLAKISVMGRQICFVLEGQKNYWTIINAAKAAGVFVQFYHLSADGELISGVQKQEKTSTWNNYPKKAEKPNPTYRNEPAQNNGFTITTTPERMNIVPIRIGRALGIGDVLYDSKKNPVRLEEKQIINPNAITYSTNIPNVWAKVYNPEGANTFLEEKAKRMLSKEVKCKGLCWPTDIIRDSAGNFVGVLIPPSKGEPLQLSVFKQAKLQTYFPEWTKKDLCDLTLSILRVIKYLHSMNILMGCINPAAIRVVGKDEVYFVDTDNYQIEGLPTLVYNTSFTPPELQGRKIYLCTKEEENYAVAVLVFMLMMPGKTPYALSPDKTVAESIKERNFAFTNGNIYGNHAMPGMWRFMWSHLSPPLKDSFFNTFQKGGKYELPNDRKTVGNWTGAILHFKEELENPTDPESLKIYPRTFWHRKNEELYTCKYCGTSHPKFYFNKRYFDDYQICNECIDKRSNVSFTCKICGKTYFYTNRTALYHAMMKKKDSDWKDQKYCRDCKNKKLRCIECGQEQPYFLMSNGRCFSCNDNHRKAVYRNVMCKDCGGMFTITVGEHEYYVQNGYNEPVRCKSCRSRKKNGGY